MRTFVPNYQTVSRVTIRSDILKLFERKKLELLDEFKRGTFSVALTSDVWSGRAKQDYVSVVAHYVDGDWNLQKRIIGFPLLDVAHNGRNISERVLNVLVNFDLHKRIIAITLDNASANNIAIELMRPNLSGFHEELFHVRCACHIVNLVVKEGLDLVHEVIQRIRCAIVYLCNSSSRVASFKVMCRGYEKRPRIFSADEPHRWNSTYAMLDEVIPYKEVLKTWIERELGEPFFEDNDWPNAEMILDFLNVFYLATTAFSNVYIPSSHTALHNIYEITKCFAKYRTHSQLQPVVVAMEVKFLKYYKTIPLLYCFGIILDPRFKLTRLNNILRLMSRHMDYDYVGTHYKQVEERFRKVFKAYEEERTNDETQSPVQSNVQAFESPVKRTYLDYEDDAREEAEASGGHWTPTSSQANDVDKYLGSRLVSSHQVSLDVLKWWKDNQLEFPILSIFARDILSVPVSTISSESAFSLSGRILDNRRMSLTPEMVQCLTCLKDWELAFRRAQYQTKNSDEMVEYFSNMYLDSDAGPSNA